MTTLPCLWRRVVPSQALSDYLLVALLLVAESTLVLNFIPCSTRDRGRRAADPHAILSNALNGRPCCRISSEAMCSINASAERNPLSRILENLSAAIVLFREVLPMALTSCVYRLLSSLIKQGYNSFS